MSITARVIEWLLMGCAIAMLSVIFVFGGQIVRGAFTGRIDALDLVLGKTKGDGTRRISDEKIWTHIGKSLLVFAMLKDASDGNPDWMLQGMLFVAIAAHEIFIRILANRENPLGAMVPGKRVTTDRTESSRTIEQKPPEEPRK